MLDFPPFRQIRGWILTTPVLGPFARWLALRKVRGWLRDKGLEDPVFDFLNGLHGSLQGYRTIITNVLGIGAVALLYLYGDIDAQRAIADLWPLLVALFTSNILMRRGIANEAKATTDALNSLRKRK